MNYTLVPVQEVNDAHLYEFLCSIDQEIVPPLSQRISLEAYPRKIKTLSIGKVVLREQKVIGLAVYYPPNPSDHYIHLALLGVHKEVRGLGISLRLLEEMFGEVKKRKAKGAKVQTWSTAHKLIKFYENAGFELYDSVYNRGSDIPSVLLRKNF